MLDALIRPLLLIALVTAAAGPWFVIAVLRPAFGRSDLSSDDLDPCERQVARAGRIAGWIALAASLPELYLQVVDIMGGSILSGVRSRRRRWSSRAGPGARFALPTPSPWSGFWEIGRAHV